MSRARRACASVLLLPALALACGSPYGAREEPSEAGLPPADGGAQDSGVVGPGDAGAPGDADASTAVVLASDDFETAAGDGSCAGWTLDPSTTAEHATNIAHAGTGACRLCTTLAAGGAMRKTLPSAGNGRYQFVSFLRRDTADAYRVTMTFGGNESGGENPLGPTSWSRAQLAGNVTSQATEFTVSIFVPASDAGGERCIYVDDVSVTFEK